VYSIYIKNMFKINLNKEKRIMRDDYDANML